MIKRSHVSGYKNKDALTIKKKHNFFRGIRRRKYNDGNNAGKLLIKTETRKVKSYINSI